MALSRQSLIEWASGWVSDIEESGMPGKRARFVAALTEELKDWREPEKKPVYCKHCPHAQHVHNADGSCGCGACTGFEADGG